MFEHTNTQSLQIIKKNNVHGLHHGARAGENIISIIQNSGKDAKYQKCAKYVFLNV